MQAPAVQVAPETPEADALQSCSVTEPPAFPQRCFRGIKSPRWLNADRRVLSDAFKWNETQVEPRRKAGKRVGPDVSINWDDDHGALPKTRADQENAKVGVAELPLGALTYAQAMHEAAGAVTWERDPKPGNEYHGNIVIAAELPKQMKHLASTILAAYAALVPEERGEPR